MTPPADPDRRAPRTPRYVLGGVLAAVGLSVAAFPQYALVVAVFILPLALGIYIAVRGTADGSPLRGVFRPLTAATHQLPGVEMWTFADRLRLAEALEALDFELRTFDELAFATSGESRFTELGNPMTLRGDIAALQELVGQAWDLRAELQRDPRHSHIIAVSELADELERSLSIAIATIED